MSLSEKYIEKTFLYFIALSLLLHGALLTVYLLMPEKKREVKQESYMVDLTDLPDMKASPQVDAKVKRFGEKRRRVIREMAPKGEMARDKTAALPRLRPRPFAPEVPRPERRPDSLPGEHVTEGATRPRSEMKPKGTAIPDLAKLYPSADRLARLEESYRKKYDTEVEEGETKFLNSEDIQFGSFLRRFESAIYGVWRYPAEAARAGIHGVTPVKITFNRKGEIERIQLLQSSGSRILDDEVFRTLHALGPLGGLPKGYNKEQFNLIAFFEYSLINGMSRGLR